MKRRSGIAVTPSGQRSIVHRAPDGADDWWEISDVREMDRNGTLVKAFEFRGEITGSLKPVLFITDDWDVFVAAEEYPPNRRDLPEDVLFSALLGAPRVE